MYAAQSAYGFLTSGNCCSEFTRKPRQKRGFKAGVLAAACCIWGAGKNRIANY